MSDELRKKWGTIFMGDREASLEQIDAMQEPIFRERNRKEQEQAYLDRVKARATERAKSILGEAYAERQKVLQEARQEAENAHTKLLEQAKQIQLQAQEDRDAAAQELARAREIRLEAEQIKERARDEGYQVGIEQANEELKVFRGEMGKGFATILQLVGQQIENITQTWREELVVLVQTAITAATGWVLDGRHEDIMRALVIKAVSQLEQREVITVRVNPQDEALVSDMFNAAREKAPEIKQWIVTADDKIDFGGLIAESGSGSVDCRREHFQDLVGGILTHLALPENEAEVANVLKIQDATIEQAQHFIPPPADPLQEIPIAMENPDPAAELSAEAGEETLVRMPASAPEIEDALEECEAEETVTSLPNAGSEADLANPVQEFAETPESPPLSDVSASGGLSESPEESAMAEEEQIGVPEAWLPPLGDEGHAESSEAIPLSLSDLEDELFPLENGDDSNVLAQGGFLAGEDRQAG